MLKRYLPFALLLSGLLVAPAGFAHNSLEAAIPKKDSVVNTLPAALELTFTDATYLVSVVLTAEDGSEVNLEIDQPVDYSTHFRLSLPPLAAGRYTVAWQVEGQDTHVIKGEYTFTLTADS